ncbi:MAG: lysine--tRNA ligase, partial [Ruminococcaceae bacterium]|nr:lysine--tRNA ligase [Oscillospiraceae bacterium]
MSEQQNVTPNEPLTEREVSELKQVRLDKLAALCEAGQNPYEITKYDVTDYNAELRAEFERREAAYIAEHGAPEEGAGFELPEPMPVRVAGRMMSRRIMGKASFVDLHDATGRIQVYVSRNDVGEEEYAGFKKWDIGDIIGLEGWVFRTKMGEISIHATAITLLSKS